MRSVHFPAEAKQETQKSQTKKPAQSNTPQADSDTTDWSSLLEGLYVESKLVDSDEQKSLLAGEIADAFWNVDKIRSRQLFRETFKSALSLPASSGKTSSIARILTLAAQRDRALARELQKQLLEQRTTDAQSGSNAVSVALTTLGTDAQLTADLAKIGAAGQPSMNSSWLVFKLVEKDPTTAQQVYELYLKNAIQQHDTNLSSLLWLGGYPFGYGEAYGGSEDVESFTGFDGLKVEGLTAQPRLAVAFLNHTYTAIATTLAQSATVAEPRKSLLQSLAYFGAAYLFPEVSRYSPESQGQWSALYRQALVGLSEDRRLMVETRIKSISNHRVKPTNPEATDENVAEKLADVEKLDDGCPRDQAYTQIALSRNYAKDFKSAIEIAGRVNTSSMHESLLQFIYFEMTDDATTRGDLNTASQLTDKVTSKSLRALLHLRIARKSLGTSPEATAVEHLSRAVSLTADGDDPEQQAGLFLSAANVYSKFDMLQSSNVTRDAIKALNRRQKQVATDSFSILRKVNLGCTDADQQWYGGRAELKDSGLSEILAVIATSDLKIDTALSLAKELEDRPTRIRAQVSIIKKIADSKSPRRM